MNQLKDVYYAYREFLNRIKADHVGAYAAQAAYFIMLSFIPAVMLLLGLIKYTPVTEAMLQKVFSESVPISVYPMIMSIIRDVYQRSDRLIPLTVVVTAWSAGRGVLALTRGFNCIYEVKETRNYLTVRIRSAIYTILILVSVVISLTVMVFGNRIHEIISIRFTIISHITGYIISFRTFLVIGVLAVFFTLIYRFLPNRKAPILLQVPGAVFTAAAWSGFSFFFSLYVDRFSNYSQIYGNLTTLIIVMLWLYVCMYIIMIGAAINSYYENKFREYREKVRKKKIIRRQLEGS